ncbi:MAG: hypothetical protein ACLFPU_06980, partial [Dehalococcoidia bacterium]
CEYSTENYGVILFEHDKFGKHEQSSAGVFLSSEDPSENYLANNAGNGFIKISLPVEPFSRYSQASSISTEKVSSAVVFRENGTPAGNGVTLYEYEEYNEKEEGESITTTENVPCLGGTPIGNDEVSSLEIDGDYWAVVFGHAYNGEECDGKELPYSGTCQLYRSSDPYVGDEPIQDNNISSVKVLPIK